MRLGKSTWTLVRETFMYPTYISVIDLETGEVTSRIPDPNVRDSYAVATLICTFILAAAIIWTFVL